MLYLFQLQFYGKLVLHFPDTKLELSKTQMLYLSQLQIYGKLVLHCPVTKLKYNVNKFMDGFKLHFAPLCLYNIHNIDTVSNWMLFI